MSTSMPKRPRNHELEEASRRAFQRALPTNWTTTTPSGDYGIDLDVEIFEAGAATGMHFGVQLKAQESAGGSPTESIKTQWREYWSELDTPTLLVLFDAATDRLWWKWTHLIDDSGAKPNAKTRSLRFATAWSGDTVSAILDEVRGFRAIRRQSSMPPTFIGFEGQTFAGGDSGPLIGAIRYRLAGLAEVTTNPAKRSDLFIRVRIAEDQIRVRLIGATPRFLHIRNVEQPIGHEELSAIATDVLALLAFAVGRAHQNRLATALLKRGIDSPTLLDENLIGDAIAELARDHATDELLQLLRRTYFINESKVGVAALVALRSVQHELTVEERRSIAQAFVDSAPTSDHAAVMIYNAAGLLRFDDFERARRYYQAAANVDEGYREKGYWWSEQAATYFHEGLFRKAEEYYAQALKLQHRPALPLLADAKLHGGKYAEALTLFEEANREPDISHAQWRLTEFAFASILPQFTFKLQVRDSSAAELVHLDGTPLNEDKITAVLNLDLLDARALWARTIVEREAGRPTIGFHLAAALTDVTFPPTWEEAIRACRSEAQSEEEAWALVSDVLICVNMFCRESFETFIFSDTFVSDQTRDELMWLLENLPQEEDPSLSLRSFKAALEDSTT